MRQWSTVNRGGDGDFPNPRASFHLTIDGVLCGSPRPGSERSAIEVFCRSEGERR